MNQVKIGKYIAEKRKKKELTQKELAEKLLVSDKAVSLIVNIMGAIEHNAQEFMMRLIMKWESILREFPICTKIQKQYICCPNCL